MTTQLASLWLASCMSVSYAVWLVMQWELMFHFSVVLCTMSMLCAFLTLFYYLSFTL